MAKDEIRELLTKGAAALGIALDSERVERFIDYKDEIQRWSRRSSLTSVEDDKGIIVTHFLDSLAGAPAGIPGNASVVDIGAGAGLPGLALKIAMPDIELLLVEAARKKAEFLIGVIEELGLSGVTVEARRAEEVGRDGRYRAYFDIAVARALARLATLMEYALPLLKTGGRVIAYKGDCPPDELDEARRAATTLGGFVEEARPAVVPFLNAKRCLIITKKVAQTDERFPRRVGVPAKRPLGSRAQKEP